MLWIVHWKFSNYYKITSCIILNELNEYWVYNFEYVHCTLFGIPLNLNTNLMVSIDISHASYCYAAHLPVTSLSHPPYIFTPTVHHIVTPTQRFFWSLGSGGKIRPYGGIIHFATKNFKMKFGNFQYTVFKILARF